MRHTKDMAKAMVLLTMVGGCMRPEPREASWRQLAQVPDAVGFAGAYAGASGGSLLVAGGANFPAGTRPWSGGVKQWSDRVFALETPEGRWKEVGRLPRPMGYGVSASWGDGLVLVGGADQRRHYADAYLLWYVSGGLHIDPLPPLPEPIANTCGALVGDVLYVAGGLSNPASTEASKGFWSLDLAKPVAEQRWESLETWPGPPRMLAVAGATDGAFHLLSGASLAMAEGDAQPTRTYLRDAYRYTPGQGWDRIADLPHAVVAAPSPAYAQADGRLLVVGGDDGSLASQAAALQDRHPGFQTAILAYDTATDTWQMDGTVPTDRQPDPENDPNASTWAPVTTAGVTWRGRYVLPMGEVRPGVRTNRVLTLSFTKP